jgi:vacuolar-type H+-ATPase subunit H
VDKRELLKSTYSSDGRSCQEIITDSQRLSDIREKKQEGERIIREAEEMRKKGLALVKEADAEEKKEKIVQKAIREFVDSDQEFIADNGEGAKVIRLSEGEKSGRTYIVIKGPNSDKQFLVLYSL